jgi:2-polyprenyl-3-methyl-5-hydroxy-6-metoxy-1,4-benzoquinol methylase
MALEEVKQCPICRSEAFGNTITCKDHTTTREVFHVKHCEKCTLGITSPRPLPEVSARYYQSTAYISHTAKSTGLINSIYLLIRVFTLKWKYRLIKPYLKENALLDYGCGTGSFLEYANKRGSPVQGVEPSPEAKRQIASSIPVVSSVNQLPSSAYDVITLWHVLEHVYTLRQTLQDLKQRLTPGGALFLAVPNHASRDASHYREYWAAYDVPRHLWHFNKESMATLLHQEGLKITAIIPMKLDAYYVSLLSERYKNSGSLGIPGMVRALIVAFQSNYAARKDGNYSSLIFVVQP